MTNEAEKLVEEVAAEFQCATEATVTDGEARAAAKAAIAVCMPIAERRGFNKGIEAAAKVCDEERLKCEEQANEEIGARLERPWRMCTATAGINAQQIRALKEKTND